MRRLSVRRLAFGVALALVGALPVVALAPAQPASAALPPVIAIGDSTLLGMTASSRAIVSAAYNFTWEAKSCRRLIITSCRGRGVIPPNTLQTMQAYAGRLGDAVVIMAGYDDWYAFDQAVDAIVGEARRQGVGHVIWLTYRSQGPYVGIGGANFATYRSFNTILKAKVAQHPELQIADWDTYTLGQSSWFAPDGIHLSSSGATALGTFIRANLDGLNLQRCYGAMGGTPTAAPTGVPIIQAAPGKITAAAGRLADTRSGAPLNAGTSLKLPLVAQGRVPAGTTSVMVNLTAVAACKGGFLTAYPCGNQVPSASHLNVLPRRTRAAMASVMLNAQGELCVYTSTASDVLVDLLGTIGGGGLGLNPTVPDRLVDTRSGAARYAHVGKLGTAPFPVPTAGNGVVPAGAKAVLVNVTVVAPDADGFVTAHTCGTAPGSSNLNFRTGQTVANAATVALAGNGTICFTSSVPTHLVVDVMGWLGDTGGLRVRAQTPERLVDTRIGLGAPLGPVVKNGNVTVPTSGNGMLATVTAVGPSATGYLTGYPCGAQPNASNLNYVAGDVVPNLVQLTPGAGGNACIFTAAPTHILVDRAATLVP